MKDTTLNIANQFPLENFIKFLQHSKNVIDNDLWYDIKRDTTFPAAVDSENDIIMHLRCKTACQDAIKALQSALRRFNKANK